MPGISAVSPPMRAQPDSEQPAAMPLTTDLATPTSKRLGPLHNKVVDDHGDKIDADAVILAGGLSDNELGPHAISARDKHGVRHAGTLGGGSKWLDAIDKLVAGINGDASRGVGERRGGVSRGRGGGGCDGGGACTAHGCDERSDGIAQRVTLQRLHARLQRGWCVACKHRAPFLHKGCARVDFSLDVVHGAARFGHARGEDRFMNLARGAGRVKGEREGKDAGHGQGCVHQSQPRKPTAPASPCLQKRREAETDGY
eukprot:scaffold221841_cov28-Tisochrysis_lutea.AAC.3